MPWIIERKTGTKSQRDNQRNCKERWCLAGSWCNLWAHWWLPLEQGTNTTEVWCNNRNHGGYDRIWCTNRPAPNIFQGHQHFRLNTGNSRRVRGWISLDGSGKDKGNYRFCLYTWECGGGSQKNAQRKRAGRKDNPQAKLNLTARNIAVPTKTPTVRSFRMVSHLLISKWSPLLRLRCLYFLDVVIKM